MIASKSTPKKVLVIGVTGLAGVRCLDWLSLRQVPNLADFQVVVISMAALSQHIASLRQERDRATPKGRKAVKEMGSRLSDDLSLLKRKLLQVLRAGGTVYAILGPSQGLVSGQPYWYSIVDSHKWIPLPVDFKDEPGEGPTVSEERFTRYFASVKHWQEVFEERYDPDALDVVIEEELDPKPLVQLASIKLATDWRGNAVGVALRYALHRVITAPVARALARATDAGDYEQDPYLTSGLLVLLPPPTEVSDEEAVRILLEDFCGIEARATAPAWAASVEIPSNRELEEQIHARRADIESIQKELEPLLTEKERREAFKAILYETGISPLQETVEAAFKELGFSTLPSDVSDEFYIEFGGQQALVEVKGVDKSASLKDVRQVIDYQLEYEQKHGSSIKGILLVNAWRNLPPEKRGLAGTTVFPDNVVKRAEANDIALVDSVQLFNALNAFWLRQVETQDLFHKLLNTRGVVTLVDG